MSSGIKTLSRSDKNYIRSYGLEIKMMRVPRIRTTGRRDKSVIPPYMKPQDNNDPYPWVKNNSDEVLPAPNTKKDYFDAVVKYDVDKIKSVFAASKLSQMQLVPMDTDIYCLPKDKIDTMVPEITTNHLHYILQRNDCDKFALKFASEVVWTYGSNGVGIILDNAGAHAYNCLIVAGDGDADPTIEIVEPQADTVISTPDAHHTFGTGLVLLF